MVTARDIRTGDELPSFTRVAYQKALDDFPFLADSSHKDNYAQSKGYKSALLSGYILCGYLSRYFVDFFGPDWLTTGEIDLAFVRAVHQREQITIRARVASRAPEKDGARLSIDFCIEKTDGVQAVVGKASGLVREG